MSSPARCRGELGARRWCLRCDADGHTGAPKLLNDRERSRNCSEVFRERVCRRHREVIEPGLVRRLLETRFDDLGDLRNLLPEE